MLKSLKISAMLFGAVLLASGPGFAQNTSTQPAGQVAPPAAGSAQAPVHRVKCGEGTYIEPIHGHEVCDDPATGRERMITPSGKHDKM
jgi:hypothetical protein